MNATWTLGKAADGSPYQVHDRVIDHGLLVCSSNAALRQAILDQALNCRLDAQAHRPEPKQVHVLTERPTDPRATPVNPSPYTQAIKSLPSLASQATTLFLPDMAAAADPQWSSIAHMVAKRDVALAAATAPEYLRNLSTEHLNIWSAFETAIITTLSPMAEETLEFLLGPVAHGAMLLTPDQCQIRPDWSRPPLTLTLNPMLTGPTAPTTPGTPS